MCHMVVLFSAWWDNSGCETGQPLLVLNMGMSSKCLLPSERWHLKCSNHFNCSFFLIIPGSSTTAFKIPSSCCSYIARPYSHPRLCRHCVPDVVVSLQKYLCLWLWRRTSPVSFPRTGGYSIAPSGTESCLRTGASLVTRECPLSLVNGD